MEREQAIKFMLDLLKLLKQKNGSDLFITVGFPPAMKIDGKVTPVSKQPLTPENAKALTYCIMNDRQLKEYEETKECNFAIAPPGVGRFRCNSFIQQSHPGLVMRTITTDIPTLDSLGLPEVLKDVCMTKNGLVILVGAPAPGKAPALRRWSIIEIKTVTVISSPLRTPSSMSTRTRTASSCSARSASIPRTGASHSRTHCARRRTSSCSARSAIVKPCSSLSSSRRRGHLALATLHANNANQALDRIINFFAEERKQQLLMDLSANLRAIISQRLLKSRSGEGRVAAIEILLNSPLIKDLILKGELHEIKPIMTKSREIGMQTFDQALFDLYEADQITYDDALRYADAQNELRLRIKLEGKAAKGKEALEGLDHLSLEESKEDKSNLMR